MDTQNIINQVSTSGSPNFPTVRLRPAARSRKWEQLALPTKKAVRALLRCLQAAVETAQTSSPKDKDPNKDPGSESRSSDVNTSVLVTGLRGSGKTTVLLSSRFASENPDSFFPQHTQSEEDNLKVSMQKIKDNIVWLDVLDLEPLPAEANLLATLLVRIRSSLETLCFRDSEPTSPYERRSEDVWNALERLTREATLMWEKVIAKDSSDQTTQQIKAAEIFGSFRKNFSDTIVKVCQLLAETRFGSRSTERVLLTLPIDNVDRSSSHLQAIMKLSQLVACRQLLLIFAAGRADFQVLLERAFHQEISSLQTGARPTCHGEDETLAIVRRQATATQRQVLPPTQRITIGALTAEEALKFEPEGTTQAATVLAELFKGIPIALPFPTGTGKIPEWLPKNLLALACRPHSEPSEHSLAELNEAGRHALTLPARNLVDLWQLAKAQEELQLDTRNGTEAEDRAVSIAKVMLRDAIDESSLPSWAVHQLQDTIICHDSHHPNHHNINLEGNPIVGRKNIFFRDQTNLPDIKSCQTVPAILKASVAIHEFCGYSLDLIGSETNRRIVLPPEVEGWFMLLYDLLYFTPGPRILNEQLEQRQQDLGIASTVITVGLEDAIVNIRLPWLIPLWSSFFERQAFLCRWRELVLNSTEDSSDSKWNRISEIFRQDARSRSQTSPKPLLAALGWIAAILSFNDPFHKDAASQLSQALSACSDSSRTDSTLQLQTATGKILTGAENLYQTLCKRREEHFGDPELKQWLEVELWLLLRSQLIGCPPETLIKGSLAIHWQENQELLCRRWTLLVRSALRDSQWYQERPEDLVDRERLLDETTRALVAALEPFASGAEHGSTES